MGWDTTARAFKGKSTRGEKVECDPITGRGCKPLALEQRHLEPSLAHPSVIYPGKPLTSVPVVSSHPQRAPESRNIDHMAIALCHMESYMNDR